jgi:integrase
MAGRLHISMRTKVKRDAATRYAALVAFVREGDADLIDRLRAQRIHITAIERCVRDRVPFATLRGTGDRWPVVTDARDQYIDWLEANENRAGATADTARNQLDRFAEYEVEGVALGTLRLDAVTTAHVTAYQTYLSTVGNDGKPYATNTRTAYIGRVAALYAFHREEEERRAIETKRQPRPLHSPVDPRTQPRGRTARERFLYRPEADALMAATPDQLRFPVAVGLLAGLRIGEALHLRPIDIDHNAGTLRVREMEWRANGKPVTWTPKTERSKRRVPINDDLAAILAHHHSQYASDHWLTPSLTDPSQPFSESTFAPLFRQIVRDADLEPGRATPNGVSYHTLRHTFASWLVMANENVLTVAMLLGNSVAMVEKTYGHLAPEHRKKAVSRLNGMVTIPPVLDPTTGEN